MTRNPLGTRDQSAFRHGVPEAEAIRSAAYAACGIADDRIDAREAEETVSWGGGGSAARQPERRAAAAILPAEVTSSLEQARLAVLEAARQTHAAYRKQQEARAAANSAENDWIVACFSRSTRGQARAANTARRTAFRAHEEAWHAYQAVAQRLCEATARMVELETRHDPPDRRQNNVPV